MSYIIGTELADRLLLGLNKGHDSRFKNLSFFSETVIRHFAPGGITIIICLDRGADLRMVQLMPLPLTLLLQQNPDGGLLLPF